MFLVDEEPMTPVRSPDEACALSESLRSELMRQWLVTWFSHYGNLSDLRLAVRTVGARVLPQSLVCIEGEWHRAHLEQTICDGCGHQLRAAAVLDVDATIGLAADRKHLVDMKASSRRILSCPKCGEGYRRRQVFWMSPEDRK
jgi:uncharacterized protein (DUF983 family)